jgi:hypothetical protein
MKNLSSLYLILFVFACGCGDNIGNPPASIVLSPPQNLKALSLSSTSVRIEWSAPATGVDSTLLGYIVAGGGRTDSVSVTQRSIIKGGLLTGPSTFSVYAFKLDGTRSNAATITWAPAARFDSAYVLHEKNTVISQYMDGLHVGSTATDPYTMVLEPTQPNVQQDLHLVLYGGSQQIQEPLAFWSDHLFVGSFNHTFFSTQVDPSSSLDLPLASFPAEETFTKDTIRIADNSIYYVKVIGDPGQVNYARIHVRYVLGSAFPDRRIEIRISLQRSAGVIIAGLTPDSESVQPRLLATQFFAFPIHS